MMVFSIISLCRYHNTKLSHVGNRTAAILVYSGFVVKIGSRIGRSLLPWLENINGEIAFIVSIPLSVIVMMICGNKRSNKVYDFINNAVHKVIAE